jgi:hypothetical protein
MISKPLVHLEQIVHLSCTDTNTVSKQTKMSFTSPRSFIGSVQNNCRATCAFGVNNVSCIKISTISTWIRVRFHLCLVISEYNQVHPKRLLILWYVWHKPSTYLAPTLTSSPNGPKQDLPWPKSTRSSIGCDQNDFWANGMFGVNYASILHQD